MQHAGRWTEAGQEIVQHNGRWTEEGQEMDHTACWQMDNGRTADGSYSMPAVGQGQGDSTGCRWTD